MIYLARRQSDEAVTLLIDIKNGLLPPLKVLLANVVIV